MRTLKHRLSGSRGRLVRTAVRSCWWPRSCVQGRGGGGGGVRTGWWTARKHGPGSRQPGPGSRRRWGEHLPPGHTVPAHSGRTKMKQGSNEPKIRFCNVASCQSGYHRWLFRATEAEPRQQPAPGGAGVQPGDHPPVHHPHLHPAPPPQVSTHQLLQTQCLSWFDVKPCLSLPAATNFC